MITRRKLFIALGAGALAAPLASFAQQQPAKIYRIGFLGAETASSDAGRVKGFRTGLRDLGYVDGVHYNIEFRWGEGKYDQLADLAAELVRQKVDVLVTVGTKAVAGASRATTTVPIVMASSGDIVAVGLVTNLARPGGNITGSTNVGRELGPKRMEMLKEVMPRIGRVAYLVNPDNPAFGPNLQAMLAAAKSLKLELQPFEVRSPDKFENAFAEIAKRRIGGLVIQDETSFSTNAGKLADLALEFRLLLAGGERIGDAGGLIGYGPNIGEQDRRAAIFVDKIFKGTKAGDIPIEQPTRFELIVNMKTAKALGIRIPQSILVQATKVIK
ncbi:MAG: ABC transporter substrate-binding protein [Betaproteobacteria bacterium]